MLKLLLLGALSAWTGIAQPLISGTVVDPEGKPIAGAVVRHLRFPLATTDANGRFSFRTDSPVVVIRGRDSAGHPIFTDREQSDLRIVLKPAPTRRHPRLRLPAVSLIPTMHQLILLLPLFDLRKTSA